jgi:hypothetical protein
MTVIPSCFCFSNICLRQVYLVDVQPEILGILLENVYVVYMAGGKVSLRVVNVTWTDLNSLAFIHRFFNHYFWIASRLVCGFYETGWITVRG